MLRSSTLGKAERAGTWVGASRELAQTQLFRGCASDNPLYAPYNGSAEEVNIIGRFRFVREGLQNDRRKARLRIRVIPLVRLRSNQYLGLAYHSRATPMQDHDREMAKESLADLTVEIVSAYVSNNTISPNEIGPLIAGVGHQLRSLGRGEQVLTPEKPEPVVPVRRSIGSDQLVCLVCGRKQKLLKRHLAKAHALTPDEYRKLFDLKSDYPMVAPSYAEKRREFALRIGLGRSKEPAKKKRAAATTKKQVPARTGRPRAKAA